MYKFWIVSLFSAVAFAGAGANGGSGSSSLTVDYNLVYGTFSLGGTSFDFLATDAVLGMVMDDGNAALVDIGSISGQAVAFYAGATALETDPVMTDNIAFTTGNFGQISDVPDPTEILDEALALNLLSSGDETSSTPIGTFPYGTVTTTTDVDGVETSTTTYEVTIEETDFTGTPFSSGAVPEPGTWILTLTCLGAIAWMRSRFKATKTRRKYASV